MCLYKYTKRNKGKAGSTAVARSRSSLSTMDNNGLPPSKNTQQHQQHVHQMPQPMYGYAMNPAWGAVHGGMMHHHQGYQYPGYNPGMEGVHLPPGIIPGFGTSSDPLEMILGTFPCVRVRGIPFEAALEDVLIFFQGFVVLDVVLSAQAGEAFVIFSNPMDYQMALQRDRQSMGRQFVEVAGARRGDYYSAVAHNQRRKEQQQEAETEPQPEVREMHDQMPNPHSNLPWHFPSGTLPSTQSVNTQMSSGRIGLPSSARGGGGRGTGGPPRRTGGGIQVGEHTGFLRMRGLPFTSAKEEILNFFDGYNIIPESVVLTYRNDGRATGEGYIGFETAEDSKIAMGLHRQMMGSRYIELFISNKEEHNRAYARFSGRQS